MTMTFPKEHVEARMAEGLVAWATKKWDIPGIIKVEFDQSYDGGWSEYTPGEGHILDAVITTRCSDCGSTTKKITKRVHYDSPELINELLYFMFGGDLPS